MTKQRIMAALALLTLLMAVVSLPQPSVLGADREPKLSSPLALDSALMEPFQDFLSTPVWLVTQGLDPRLTRIKGNPLGNAFPPQEAEWKGIPLQAGGGGQGPLVPYRNPSPKFSRNILVTRDFSNIPFQTEPSLAVDPKDPEHILLGVIDYNFPGITTYTSIDGGGTWEGPYQVKYPSDDDGAAGDPVVAFDRQGKAYAASISLVVEEFTVGNAVGSALTSAIPIATSVDGGRTWTEPIAAARSHLKTSVTATASGEPRYEIELPFLDKPWMAVGPSRDGPAQDVIYVTYTQFVTHYEVFFALGLPFLGVPTTETSIEMVRSEDGGRTWSAPVAVSPIVFSTIGEDAPNRVVQGSQPVVAPDGTLYVAWMDSTDDKPFKGLAEIYVAKSDNGGRTFIAPVAVSAFGEPNFSARNAFFRMWGSGFPQISVGPNGEVYIVYTGRPTSKSDDGDIFFVASRDRGASWSRPKVLNDDGTSRLQFFPSVSAGPDGVIHVMWGDMRDDLVETRYHIYYTSSEDGGDTWNENARVTDFPSNPNYAFPNGAFIGDYFTITATEKDVYMAWPDSRLGEFGPQNQKIAFARKELMPLPAIFLSPPSGPGGKDIAILGSNFQPDQDVFLEISGVVVSTVRSDGEGRFNARIFIPISGEGAHDFRAIDASGNTATGAFYMDFGFDNIQGSIQDIVGQLGALDQRLKDSTQSPPELPSQLQTIQESLKSLDQLQDIQSTLKQLETKKESQGVETWVMVVIAGVVALLASSLGVMAGIRFASRKTG